MQKYSSVITIERFLVQNFANYRTMAEISTAKKSFPKSPTELEKDGPSFSSLFSLASACAAGDIAPCKKGTTTVVVIDNNCRPMGAVEFRLLYENRKSKVHNNSSFLIKFRIIIPPILGRPWMCKNSSEIFRKKQSVRCV